ncbi:K(+)-transporting ATPase subunit F [Xanthobacter pseudotagetidis]
MPASPRAGDAMLELMLGGTAALLLAVYLVAALLRPDAF